MNGPTHRNRHVNPLIRIPDCGEPCVRIAAIFLDEAPHAYPHSFSSLLRRNASIAIAERDVAEAKRKILAELSRYENITSNDPNAPKRCEHVRSILDAGMSFTEAQASQVRILDLAVVLRRWAVVASRMSKESGAEILWLAQSAISSNDVYAAVLSIRQQSSAPNFPGIDKTKIDKAIALSIRSIGSDATILLDALHRNCAMMDGIAKPISRPALTESAKECNLSGSRLKRALNRLMFRLYVTTYGLKMELQPAYGDEPVNEATMLQIIRRLGEPGVSIGLDRWNEVRIQLALTIAQMQDAVKRMSPTFILQTHIDAWRIEQLPVSAKFETSLYGIERSLEQWLESWCRGTITSSVTYTFGWGIAFHRLDPKRRTYWAERRREIFEASERKRSKRFGTS